MKFHREGHRIIAVTFSILLFINLLLVMFTVLPCLFYWIVAGITFIFFLLVVQFFRVPNRTTPICNNEIICPSDGKVVVIEEVHEHEFVDEKRIQVSVFMSPLNVHVNWFPISGIVKYFKYHPGKFLVAWHPKSSIENERTTVVVENKDGKRILFRQIAGAVARRIICYAKEGQPAQQGEEFGFIKFGSRIDILLPLDAKIKVEIGQKVVGAETVIATFE